MQRDGEAAAAASYRVLSRLLGYGAGQETGAAGGPGNGAVVVGLQGPGGVRLPVPAPGGAARPPPQLMVFRNTAENRTGNEEEETTGGGEGPEGGTELLCPRHRCVLEPKGATGAGYGPPGGLELQLAALGLRAPGAKGPAACPCVGPPAAEETSDALLVLEALEPDETESCSEDEPGSPAHNESLEPPRGATARRAAMPGPGAAGGRKGSLRVRLSRLFRTKSCSGGSVPGDGNGGNRRGTELTGSAQSLSDGGGARGRGQEEGRKHRLTRTQSAFSPVVFSPLFTGETVSLVDVDISQRGLSSPHPPTPPPPPRRSLSLLDAFPRIVPLRPTEPAPTQPTPHLQCPLYRPDSSSFAASLRELEKCGWYWGPMNWEDAEMKLKGKPDGSFLVRDSSDPRYILSLSFRSQGITHHTRMEHYRGTFSLWCHPKFEDRCQSVVEFIKRAIMHSKNGKFLYFLRSRVPGLPPTPVQLLYPVSRFSNVKSLQHLCRFRIRQLVRIDHIPELPLPKPLISYIRKFYYYDPQEEVYLSLKEAQLISRQKQDAESST
ncbi:suppressor of cytokine signaling 7 isoform X2 [Coturnix japonica]|uniref:Suppressor of cytokine signaling 7 n=1 Tax=Coturnix japonica TaxID=93934 RepID=A0A8C2SME9_COTJA|nr:suppressor of cytokine signaling 7 isoform X2 [Coturnix japonica]